MLRHFWNALLSNDLPQCRATAENSQTDSDFSSAESQCLSRRMYTHSHVHTDTASAFGSNALQVGATVHVPQDDTQAPVFLNHTRTVRSLGICTCPVTDTVYPCYFTPLQFSSPSQAQHSLETQHGSLPIIAIVAIFIALEFFQSGELLFVFTATVTRSTWFEPPDLTELLCIIKLARTLYIVHTHRHTQLQT